MTSDIIKGFNRDTRWLATGVLGSVVFAALMLAVQEYHPTKVKPTEEVVEAGSDRLLNADVVTVGSVVAKSSNDKIASGEGSKASPQDDPTDSETSALRQDSARSIGPEARNARNKPSVAFRFIDVKRRLIKLWHQNLAITEKSRSWTAFSNLNRGVSKKAAYTAETNR